MKRRQFIELIPYSGLALLAASCGVAPQSSMPLGASRASRKVIVHDLVMEGWSTLGSGRLGSTGVLRASQIREFKDLELNYIQDPHGHKFTLTRAELAKLLLGERCSVFTTYAQGHRHEVRINPANPARGSQPIEVEIDERGWPVDAG